MKILYIALLPSLLYACSGSDMTYPLITDLGVPNPIDCQVYHRGEDIKFCYVFTDDTELGNFNIEIHNNFDHHTHGTSSAECEDHDEHDEEDHDEHEHDEEEASGHWVFSQDYAIPEGQTTYEANLDIHIPGDIEPGDYHFMIRLTDAAGWQQLKAMGIKVTE